MKKRRLWVVLHVIHPRPRLGSQRKVRSAIQQRLARVDELDERRIAQQELPPILISTVQCPYISGGCCLD